MVNFTPPSELGKIQTTFSDDSLIVISVYNSNTRKYESTCSVKYSDFIKHFVHAENGDNDNNYLKYAKSIDITSNSDGSLRFSLKDKNNTVLSYVDHNFDIGAVIQSATYEDGKLILTFSNGSVTEIPLTDLTNGLQKQLTPVKGIKIEEVTVDGTVQTQIGHSNSEITAQNQSKIYKIKHDNFGHIIESTAVVKEDITSLGIPAQNTTYTAGSGLTLEGTQIKHSSTVQAQQNGVFKKIAYNGTGHIIGISDVSYDDVPSVIKDKISTLESNKVDKSTTVNNKNLGSNITLDGSDIKLTGYEKPQETGTIASTDTINEAIGKLEKGSYWVKKTIDLTGWDENYWFPVTGTPLANGANNHILVDVQLNSGSHPNWSTHDRGYTVILDMIVTAAGWGTTYGNSICLQHSAKFVENEQEPPVSYWQLTKSSTPVLWCRGGGKYFVWTNYECNWTPHNFSGVTIQEETVEPRTTYPNLDFAKSTIIANTRSDSIELTGTPPEGPNIKSIVNTNGIWISGGTYKDGNNVTHSSGGTLYLGGTERNDTYQPNNGSFVLTTPYGKWLAGYGDSLVWNGMQVRTGHWNYPCYSRSGLKIKYVNIDDSIFNGGMEIPVWFVYTNDYPQQDEQEYHYLNHPKLRVLHCAEIRSDSRFIKDPNNPNHYVHNENGNYLKFNGCFYEIPEELVENCTRYIKNGNTYEENSQGNYLKYNDYYYEIPSDTTTNPLYDAKICKRYVYTDVQANIQDENTFLPLNFEDLNNCTPNQAGYTLRPDTQEKLYLDIFQIYPILYQDNNNLGIVENYNGVQVRLSSVSYLDSKNRNQLGRLSILKLFHDAAYIINKPFMIGNGLDIDYDGTTIKHSTDSGYKHIPTGGYWGSFLTWDSDGTARWSNSINSIEFTGSNHPEASTVHGGFIDFHYAESTDDYTTRIAEYERGVLTIGAKNTSGVEVGGTIRTSKDPSNDDDLTRKGYVDSSISAVIINIIGSIYPIGSVYIDAADRAECPIKALLPNSTWQKIEGRYLLGSGQLGWTIDETHNVGDDVGPGLPNITGTIPGENVSNYTDVNTFWNSVTGAFFNNGNITDNKGGRQGGDNDNTDISFDASRSSWIYGQSLSVRPPSRVVNIWQRTS